MAQRRQPPKDFTDLTGMRADLYCRVSHIDPTGHQSVDEKSVDDQEREGGAWAERAGVQLGEIFRDPGLSASRFATKDRPEFQRLMKHVETGQTDIVWVWAIDRSQRDLRVFGELRDVFQRQQVALSVNGRLTDPNDYDGWMLLGITSFFGERFSEELSKNVRRGKDAVASDGRPAAGALFGYVRRRSDNRPPGLPDHQVWFSKTHKMWVWQEPDLWDGDGRPVEDSPAWVVREIYRRVVSGDAVTRIALDLTDRRIPKSRSGVRRWYPTDVRRIAVNPGYIAKRVHHVDDWHHGEALAAAILPGVEATWPALVDDDTFWAAHRILTDPLRKRTRPARARSLLSFVVLCAKCGGPVSANLRSAQRQPGYMCRDRGCAAITQQVLDDYVEEVMIKYLSREDVAAAWTRVDDSAIAKQARDEAIELERELAQLYRDAEAGEVSSRIATGRERVLKERIAEAEKRAREVTMDPIVAEHVGPEAEAKWNRANNEVKRQLIQHVAEISLKPTGRQGPVTLADVAKRAGVNRATVSAAMGRRNVHIPVSKSTRQAVLAAVDELGYDVPHRTPVNERVEWRWLLGPDAD